MQRPLQQQPQPTSPPQQLARIAASNASTQRWPGCSNWPCQHRYISTAWLADSLAVMDLGRLDTSVAEALDSDSNIQGQEPLPLAEGRSLGAEDGAAERAQERAQGVLELAAMLMDSCSSDDEMPGA
jgi:hypothetical protein